MRRTAPPVSDPLISDAIRAEIATCPDAVLVVAAGSARIVAANEAAEHLLDIRSPAGATLDSAMPAVERIRAFGRGAEARSEPQALTFWTLSGTVTFHATLAALPGAGNEPLVLVRAVSVMRAEDARAVSHAAENPVEADASVGDAGAQGTRDDPAEPQPASPVPDALGRAKLAHELKTPIGAITTAAELMTEARFGPLGNPRYEAYAADILVNARHALALIDRMLSRSPIGEGTRKLVLERLDLNPLVESVVITLSPRAEDKGVEIATTLSPDAPSAMADATSIRQVLLNLLTNAVKFTPPGGLIRVETLKAPNGSAIARVCDTGPGMTPAEIEEALKPVPDDGIAQERPGGGLGLGLPIAYALAEANGATLEIESEIGVGTEISVRFPGGRLVVV